MIGVVTDRPDSHSRDAIHAELVATVDPKAADERLLVEMAASAASVVFRVSVAVERLAALLPEVLADTRKASSVAKTLHEMVVVGNALSRRVESTLSTAAALRIQRRLHRGGRDDL